MVTRREDIGQPLCFMAGSVFRTFPSKDQKQPAQRKWGSELLELSPAYSRELGASGCSDGGGGEEDRSEGAPGNQIKMALFEKFMKTFSFQSCYFELYLF